ncbi:MAG: hypothetical protein DRO11_07155 [Methanobacteriota archaeon]|nr:MAG: hypothetical protein DRO11_07155 [Euryarchaeota archaeon]
MRYDREGDILDILVGDGQIHHAEEHGRIIVNYDEEGRVVEIEILDASKMLSEVLAESLGHRRGK